VAADESIVERWGASGMGLARVALLVGGGLVVAVLLLVQYEDHVARPVGTATGTVVTSENQADGESPPTYHVYVRLDVGPVVHVRNTAGAVAPVGRRVELAECVGPLTGRVRYRLQRVL
jgi:hypothetical protein